MKVESVKLKNYRIFEDAEIVFDQPLSVIRGNGHSGKSSIGRAIKLGLSKSSQGTDPRGAGAIDQVKTGATKAEIELAISGKAAVEMRVTYGPGKTGRQQNVIGQQPGIAEAFAQYLDQNQERLSCVLDSEYFVNPKTDQKAILAALVLPTTHEFDDDVKLLVEKYLGRQDWTTNPSTLIDWIYGDDRRGAYSERKQAKAILNNITIPSTPQKPEYTDRDEIQTKLYDLRKKATTESSKLRRGGTVNLGRAQQQVETLTSQKAQEEKLLEEARKNFKGWGEHFLTPAAIKKHQKVAGGRASWNALQKTFEAWVKSANEGVTAREIYRAMLDAPICFTCTQPISEPFVREKVAGFQAAIDKAVENQASIAEQQKALGDIDAAEKALADDKERHEKQDAWDAEITRLEASVKRVEFEIGNATKVLDAAKAEESNPPDTSALDAVNAEIGEWEARLGPAIQYQTTLAAIETSKSMRTTQQQKVNDLERLCTIFGKDGIRATLIQEHVDGFSKVVNRTLATWGYEAELDIEAGTFMITNLSDGTVLPLKELSGSEQMFVKIALQAAIAFQSGIKMIVVDPLDQIDEHDRALAFACIRKMLEVGALHQAILIGHDLSRDVDADEGVGYYFVDNGVVERLQCEVAA